MSDIQRELDSLHDFIESCGSIVVLTGAGASASSGIPTYRDGDGTWRGARPIKHDEFLQDASGRQRYWLRSMAGWPAVRDARPNAAHVALSQLEKLGKVSFLITQNVDRLHQRAGSEQVVDLHGRLDRVQCQGCYRYYDREQIQTKLAHDNPCMQEAAPSPRPDGDADIAENRLSRFRVPACLGCGGILMPDVVFFGGTVPKKRVQACMEAIETADALLAVGSSLQVFSGFRFCRGAARMGKPVGLINPGRTRADDLASMKWHSDCGPLLSLLARRYLAAG